MSPEMGILLGYAGLLLLGAIGLERLGRVDTSPWHSRMLSAHRRRHPEAVQAADADRGSWPDQEQARVHTVMAGVAASVATVLAVVVLLRSQSVAATMPSMVLLVGSTWVEISLGERLWTSRLPTADDGREAGEASGSRP